MKDTKTLSELSGTARQILINWKKKLNTRTAVITKSCMLVLKYLKKFNLMDYFTEEGLYLTLLQKSESILL